MQTDYKTMYGVVWQFHKRNIQKIDDSDKFWDTVRNEALQIGKRFNEHPFVVNLIMNELGEFERIYKEKNKPP